jgi:predicted nucleic acid-binding protein
LSISLGLGEASSLAVAACRGFRFASDDQAARREAGRLGVGLTGTIGILAKAVRLRICDIKNSRPLSRENDRPRILRACQIG